jgi:hypothetical protein
MCILYMADPVDAQKWRDCPRRQNYRAVGHFNRKYVTATDS